MNRIEAMLEEIDKPLWSFANYAAEYENPLLSAEDLHNDGVCAALLAAEKRPQLAGRDLARFCFICARNAISHAVSREHNASHFHLACAPDAADWQLASQKALTRFRSQVYVAELRALLGAIDGRILDALLGLDEAVEEARERTREDIARRRAAGADVRFRESALWRARALGISVARYSLGVEHIRRAMTTGGLRHATRSGSAA